MRVALVVVIGSAACGRFDFAPQTADAAAPRVCADDPTLLACYLFDGDALDGSRVHRATDDGGGVSFAPGVHGLAAQFTPPTALHIPESPTLDPTALTIQAWIRLDADVPAGQRMGIVDNNNQWGIFVLPDHTLQCRTSSPGLNVGGGTIPTGSWTHIACTEDQDNVTAWIGGAIIQTLPAPGPVSTSGTNGTRIGGNLADSTFSGDDGLVGAIDDLEIWSTVRSAADLCADAGSC